MMRYDWTFNGARHDPRRLNPVRAGELVRLEFGKTTMMWHPVHLHGHTFAPLDGALPQRLPRGEPTG